MENHQSIRNDNKNPGFTGYVAKRLILAALVIILVVWAFGSAPKTQNPENHQATPDTHADKQSAEATLSHTQGTAPSPAASFTNEDQPQTDTHPTKQAPTAESDVVPPHQPPTASKAASDHTSPQGAEHTGGEEKIADTKTPSQPSSHDAEPQAEPTLEKEKQPDRTDEPNGSPAEQPHIDLPVGVAFVEATIEPIAYELNNRFWGWRPNDIVNFTDNVNNFQLGVLEVTRRTVVLLAERISRTGTTDAFNPHLENAMNWLMVKADRYWFPAPESKYKESIEELEAYKEELLNGRGSYYTRTDNLIPLLSSYEDLLGSSDENLVKQKNEDGSDVSLFKADDYFYYAKGVASTLATILEAIHHDFEKTLDSRHATELLHHALESCRQAAALDPLLITNGDLDGILANHRANMAAPISHARFYIGQLIKTLST